MTTHPYIASAATLEPTTTLATARRIVWLIVGLCILFVAGGALWLGVLYVVSFAELPRNYATLARLISESQDISALKNACLSLTKIDEADWRARRNWILWAPTLAISLAVIAGTLSIWLLVALKRIEKHLKKIQL